MGQWDSGVVFLLPILPWTDPPLGAVLHGSPTPPLSKSATGASPSPIGSRQRSLDPALLVGVCSGAFRTSSCTRGTTSSESSESRLCNSRTGSASPACHGHTKGRVAHPPASNLRTVSQGQSRGSPSPAVPGATCPPTPSVHAPPSALRTHDAPGRQHAPIDTVNRGW